MDKKALLEWYVEAGVDEAVDDKPTDHFKPAPKVEATPEKKPERTMAKAAPLPQPVTHTPKPSAASVVQATSRALADRCKTLEELRDAVMNFDGCELKKSANKTVFSDGNPKATVMVIGEAPGAQEDEQGIPFCGPSGQLLDKVLASIGLTRAENLYIANTIFWRPPGNRTPSPEETAMCLPFVEKHIALINPKLLLLAGGVATTTLLGMDTSISRLRGKTYEYKNPYLPAPIPTMVTYHPSYLMRSPSQKRLAWQDMLMVKGLLGK